MFVNKKYKDNLFRMIFGKEKYKENLLSLYNAVNNTQHTDLSKLEINTLDQALYMSYKNDVSCIVEADNIMSLFEHQSTYNQNMPLRGVIYMANLYEKYIESHGLDFYRRKRISIPTPRYFVFYIGNETIPDRVELKLSDMYEGEGDLECTATILNINISHNKELLEKCSVLYQYSYFITSVYDKKQKYGSIELAVEEAIEECINKDILKDVLISSRAEVKNMILEEYNEKEHIANEKQDSFEEGLEEGLKQGLKQGLEQGTKLAAVEAIKKILPTLSKEEIIKMGFDEKLVDEAIEESKA